MCLITTHGVHNAKMNIRCDKVLVFRKSPKGYKTPYQGYPVTFDERGVAVLSLNGGRLTPANKWLTGNEWCYGYYVGIHSCYHPAAIEELFDKLSLSNPFLDHLGHAHPAVIPKGAEFTFGDRGDAVSSELIVFKDEEAYKTWVGENGGAERAPDASKPDYPLQPVMPGV